MELSEIIKMKREELGLTLQEIGDALGVSRATVKRYETGEIKNLKQETIEKLAQILRVTPAYLMGWEENENTPCLIKEPSSTYNVYNAFKCDFVEIPIVGSIRAGQPIFAEDNLTGYIPVLKNSLKKDYTYFGLIVKGDSMNLEFEEGTTLVIEKTPCIENNEIGVVRINGNEATVKKVVINGDMITLIPCSSNKEHIPMMYNLRKDDIEIIGKVKQAIKNY